MRSLVLKIGLCMQLSFIFFALYVLTSSKDVLLLDEGDYLRGPVGPDLGFNYNPTSRLAKYYYNLNSNYSTNEHGSCTYVALCMLLTYYDSFCYDNIIPEWVNEEGDWETFDVFGDRYDSPGISSYFGFYDFLQNRYGNTLFTPDRLQVFVNFTKDENLQSQLVNIGVDKGYHTGATSLGSSISNSINVLKSYLINNGFPENVAFQIHRKSDYPNLTNIQFLNQAFQGNNPVYVSCIDGLLGHAVIAYDYVSENDYILCHSGQKNTYVPTFRLVSDFGYINDMFYITLNANYKMESNNYHILNEYVCGCEVF